MRSLVTLAVLLVASPALATSTLICDSCRSPYEFPKDYGNYLYNQVFGPDASLSISEANQVKICNPSGQWAMVDIDMILGSTGLDIDGGLLGFAVNVPTGELRIKVQDPAGTMTEYDVFWNSPPLDVGGEPYESPTEEATVTSDPEPTSSDPVESTGTTSGGGGEYYSYTYWGVDGTWYWYYDTGEFANDLE